MKKVEIESFFKSFLLFFSSMMLLMTGIFYFNYNKELQVLDESILNEMRVCSFELNCESYNMEFSDKADLELYTLQKNDKEIYANFPILNSTENALKFSLSKEAYQSKTQGIKNELAGYFLGVIVSVMLLSALFSLYSLSPLRNALRLTEEFIKDILHDFNTPLSTLRLNSSMLLSELGENTKLLRIQTSVQNILDLQDNLRAYLSGHEHQKQRCDLQTIIQERVSFFEKNNPQLHFENTVPKEGLSLHLDSFIRIIDNLLSNAVKYNKKNGSITLLYKAESQTLVVKDTGQGISNVNKVFDRFYKEHDRGLGIGLHIVKKLCDEMGIKVSVKSQIGIGSEFFLELKKVLSS